MKPILAKVSVALLSTVFIVGCQDQGSGPVGPDGLVPQFGKVDKNCDPPDPHPSCKPPDDPGGDVLTFDVTMHIGTDHSSALPQTGRVHNDDTGILIDNFELDLTFLGLACIPAGLVGGTDENATFKQISGGDGSDGFFQFLFFLNGVRHSLTLRATIDNPDTWLPTDGAVNKMTPRDNGDWSVTASGKGHKQNGCTGDGDDAVWEAHIVAT